MTAEQVAKLLLTERIALTAHLRAFVRVRATAEDLFQEVSVKAIAAPADFNDEVHLMRWFRKVARHRAIDYLRRAENRRLVFDDDVIELLATEADEFEEPAEGSRERIAALESCMAGLTEKSREVIRLRYGEELSGLEVAGRLNRKPDTVYKMLARSYSQLRECIEGKLATKGAGS